MSVIKIPSTGRKVKNNVSNQTVQSNLEGEMQNERRGRKEKKEREESGKRLHVDVKFPLSKANRPGLPTSQQPTNNGDTGPLSVCLLVIFFYTVVLPAEWRRKGKLSAEKDREAHGSRR